MSENRPRWLVRRFREANRDSQWLIPLLGAVSGVILAQLVGTGGPEDNPWTVTVDRSRDTLASAMALVFTSFSIVLALVSVAAQNVVGRFGSRVARLYGRRSPDQWVIGAFAMAAAFILSEQFQLRRLDPDAPAPVAGLSISVLLLVFSGALVIVYIAAIVRWFRVDRAVAGVVAVARESARAVTRDREGESVASLPQRPDNAVDIPAPKMGHLAEIDADVLLGHSRRLDAMAVIPSRSAHQWWSASRLAGSPAEIQTASSTRTAGYGTPSTSQVRARSGTASSTGCSGWSTSPSWPSRRRSTTPTRHSRSSRR